MNMKNVTLIAVFVFLFPLYGCGKYDYVYNYELHYKNESDYIIDVNADAYSYFSIAQLSVFPLGPGEERNGGGGAQDEKG